MVSDSSANSLPLLVAASPPFRVVPLPLKALENTPVFSLELSPEKFHFSAAAKAEKDPDTPHVRHSRALTAVKH